MTEEFKFESGQEVSLEQAGETAKTILRGWKEGRYIIVDLPAEGAWRQGGREPIIGRLLGEGSYCGFTTEHVGVIIEFKLLILKYPMDIVGTPFRKSARFDTAMPVKITRKTAKGAVEDTGVVTNISQSGCRLVCSKPYKPLAKLDLLINFPAGTSIEKIPCILRSMEQHSDKYVYGVEFDIIDEDDLQPLSEYLEQLSVFQTVTES